MEHSNKKALPSHFPLVDRKTPVYRAHGKYEFGNGHTILSKDKGMPLGAGIEAQACLKKGTLNGRPLTYVSKMWSIWSDWRGFFVELFLYSSSKRLRPLQGGVVPYFIGVYDVPGGCVSFAMEPPHPIRWREADTSISDHLKEKVITAFEDIHRQGVLHGDPALRHVLIGDDEKVNIIDFGEAQCVEPNSDIGLLPCDSHDFDREIRAVKFCLDYNGAKMIEYARVELKEVIDSRNAKRREIQSTMNSISDEAKKIAYQQEQLTAHGLESMVKENYPSDIKKNTPFKSDELAQWDLAKSRPGWKGKCFEVPISHQIASVKVAEVKLECLPSKTSDPSSSAPKLNVTGAAISGATSSMQPKRRRADDRGHHEPPPKKAKAIVGLHPNTIDNKLWVTRGVRSSRHPVTTSSDQPDTAPPTNQSWVARINAALGRATARAKALAEYERVGSDKANYDPSSPPSVLPDVEPPRRSPPPELRDIADPFKSTKEKHKALRRLSKRGAATTAECTTQDNRQETTNINLGTSPPSEMPVSPLKPDSLVPLCIASKTYSTVTAGELWASPVVEGKLTAASDTKTSSSSAPDTKLYQQTITPPSLSPMQIAQFKTYMKAKIDPEMSHILEQLMSFRCQRAWEAGFNMGLKNRMTEATSTPSVEELVTTSNGGNPSPSAEASTGMESGIDGSPAKQFLSSPQALKRKSIVEGSTCRTDSKKPRYG